MTAHELFFKSALIQQPSSAAGWMDNVSMTIRNGVIEAISTDRKPKEGAKIVSGVAVPSMVNVHSHAFQRAFGGLSEFRTANKDSFWTWRKLMYDFALKLTPDDVYVIARQLYLEMVNAGYSWVGEFQYLHNDKTGQGYSDRARMAQVILKAATDSGIGVCLLPVLYQQSGFDVLAPIKKQRRFILSLEDYWTLLGACKNAVAALPNAAVGMAVHSLRAASKDSIQKVIEFRKKDIPDCPVHIHIAEQIQEVKDCISVTGKRPVEYLLSNFDIDENWCLIHATHLTDEEVHSLARAKVVVGLCPTTEANLGDGIFQAKKFLGARGRFAIGSDSHCSVDPREELRLLEYGQRLSLQQRAILGSENESVGRQLYQMAAECGGKALGVKTGKLGVGYRADLLVIDDQHSTVAGAQEDRLLDRFIFSNTGNPIAKRMIGGRWIEKEALAVQLAQSQKDFVELNQRLLG